MKAARRRRLERAGWAVGDAAGFLGLSAQEAALVEMKLALAERLRTQRASRRLSQAAVARLLGSSQSRVAKMEAGDATVSIDLLVRSLLAIGATKRDIARAIGGVTTRRAA
jgi:predicted XRE-type DNA-binding protein